MNLGQILEFLAICPNFELCHFPFLAIRVGPSYVMFFGSILAFLWSKKAKHSLKFTWEQAFLYCLVKNYFEFKENS